MKDGDLLVVDELNAAGMSKGLVQCQNCYYRCDDNCNHPAVQNECVEKDWSAIYGWWSTYTHKARISVLKLNKNGRCKLFLPNSLQQLDKTT